MPYPLKKIHILTVEDDGMVRDFSWVLPHCGYNDDLNATIQLLFSYIDDILQDYVYIETVGSIFDVLYPHIPSSAKNTQGSSELAVCFVRHWIRRLEEMELIEHGRFNYYFKGVLRDGAIVFQRKDRVD